MKKALLFLMALPALAGTAAAQDPGCFSMPYVLRPVDNTVCYLGRLVDKPHFMDIGFSFYEPEQTLRFEVVNFDHDPFAPKFLTVRVEDMKYRREYFKEGEIYSVLAEFTEGPLTVPPPVVCEQRSSRGRLFYPLPVEKMYHDISIVRSE